MHGAELPVVETGAGTPAPTAPAATAPVPPARWAPVASALRVAVVPWLAARAVVLVALAVGHRLDSTSHLSAAGRARVHEGLLGWDAGWYESIAGHGYAGAGHASLRFFPFFPLFARGLAELPALGVGAAVVVVANLSALVATGLVVLLVRRETGDENSARRSAWLLSLAPPAFVLVMGYAEGTLLVCTVGTFLALRGRRWWWAAGLGLAAGLTRPLGLLLFLPAAVEAGRGLRAASTPDRVGRLAAVVAPVVGTGAFLGWVGWRYGDALTPLRLQEEGVHHGHLVDPLVTLGHDATFLVHHHHLGQGLHLPWVLLTLVLVVVCFRTWPASYGLFAAAVLAVALAGSNLDSFERYALSAFPLVLAVTSLTRSRRVAGPVLVLMALALFGYALLAFTNLYVP